MDKYTIEELEAHVDEIDERLLALNSEYEDRPFTEAADEEFKRLRAEREATSKRIAHQRERKEYLASLKGDGDKETDGEDRFSFEVHSKKDPFDQSQYRGNPEEINRQYRDGAMRALEVTRFESDQISKEEAQTRVERLLDTRDVNGEIARRVLATGGPVYKRAFNKKVAGVPLNEDEQRALSLTTTAGGFAVPFTLDPTVLLTSNGQINPMRAISRVEQIVTDEWNGVSSAGVTGTYGYAAAVTEAGDNSPTLAQPSVKVEKGQVFIPFNIEIGEDWAGIGGELSRMFADAKDEVEADKFLNGTGTNEPQGLIEYLDDAGQSASWVDSSTYNAFAAADVYLLEENLGPRFRTLAKFLAHKAIYNRVRRFDTQGGAQMWERIGAGQPAELLGYPAVEASQMGSTVAAGDFPLVFGDFRHFLIADRVGMSVELIPHLFATGSNRPSGSRGLYAYWRNGSGVLVPGAFRILRIEPSS